MVTVPLTIVSDQERQHDSAHRFDHHDHPPPIDAIRRRAADHAEQQHRQVARQQRQRDQERVMGLRGHQQWAGRDHDPSPTLLTTVADSSQRKLTPRRGGAMVSTREKAWNTGLEC